MFSHWLFSQHKAKYSPPLKTLQCISSTYFIIIFERIVNMVLSLPPCLHFLLRSLYLASHSMTLLNLVGQDISDFHAGPFSFSFAASSVHLPLTDPQDSAKNPLVLFLVYLLSFPKLQNCMSSCLL